MRKKDRKPSKLRYRPDLRWHEPMRFTPMSDEELKSQLMRRATICAEGGVVVTFVRETYDPQTHLSK